MARPPCTCGAAKLPRQQGRSRAHAQDCSYYRSPEAQAAHLLGGWPRRTETHATVAQGEQEAPRLSAECMEERCFKCTELRCLCECHTRGPVPKTPLRVRVNLCAVTTCRHLPSKHQGGTGKCAALLSDGVDCSCTQFTIEVVPACSSLPVPRPPPVAAMLREVPTPTDMKGALRDMAQAVKALGLAMKYLADSIDRMELLVEGLQ